MICSFPQIQMLHIKICIFSLTIANLMVIFVPVWNFVWWNFNIRLKEYFFFLYKFNPKRIFMNLDSITYFSFCNLMRNVVEIINLRRKLIYPPYRNSWIIHHLFSTILRGLLLQFDLFKTSLRFYWTKWKYSFLLVVLLFDEYWSDWFFN